MAKQDTTSSRILLDQLLDLEADVEARPLPRDVNDVIPKYLCAEFPLIHRGSYGDDCIWVQMVDMLEGDKRVQRRVDGAGSWIQAVYAVAVHRIHPVLDPGLGSAMRIAQVERFHGSDLVEIERCKAIALCCPEISAGSLDPEHLDILVRQRIFLGEFR
jgi:hypothetical protein